MPFPIAAAITAGGGLLSGLLSRRKQWEMSPEARNLYQTYLDQYRQPDSALGYSGAEKGMMLGKVNEALGQKTAQNQASLQRRGMLSAGQMGGMATDIGNQYGEAATDIELNSLNAGRQRKDSLRGAMSGLLGGQQFMPEQDASAGVGGTLGNLYLAYLMNKKKQQEGGTFPSAGFMPGLR